MSDIKTSFQLSGLHCESCKKITEKRAKKISGVKEASTDVSMGILTITSDREVTKNEIINALTGTDYKVL